MGPYVAALYVAKDGPYFNVEGVDPWDESRDARTYQGPWKVVAHPPCARWGRYAKGGPNPKARRFEIGEDGGCFEAALAAVRKWGGVLEHPAGSHAFKRFDLPLPPKVGWSERDAWGGRSCQVDQGAYGHPAKKATWLYARLREYPNLNWTRVANKTRLELGPRSKEAAKAIRASPDYRPPKRLTRKEREHTPAAFRDELLALVRLDQATCPGYPCACDGGSR